ncbi:hypothetical protein BGZ68_005615, partial [Mortierella alpina]
MEIGELEAHFEVLWQDDFNVAQYMNQFENANGKPKPYPYVLRGFVRSDGFRLQKDKVPHGGSRSVTDNESSLPPIRGQQGSMEKYVAELEQVQTALDGFYRDNHIFKKHQWDHEKAKEGECAIITDRILKMVGCAVGEKRRPGNPVIIALGLGDVSSSFGLTSLHGSFKDFFVQE